MLSEKMANKLQTAINDFNRHLTAYEDMHTFLLSLRLTADTYYDHFSNSFGYKNLPCTFNLKIHPITKEKFYKVCGPVECIEGHDLEELAREFERMFE